MLGLRSDGRDCLRWLFRRLFRRLFRWTILPLKSNFRACVVLAWFHPSSSCFFDYISRVVGKIDVSGAMNIRRMSGDWIASVCRLCARAPNYRPTILLSYFNKQINACWLDLGTVLRTYPEGIVKLCLIIVCGISFDGEIVNTKAGTCDPCIFA